jgi:hypothetical protein
LKGLGSKETPLPQSVVRLCAIEDEGKMLTAKAINQCLYAGWILNFNDFHNTAAEG